MLAHGNFQGYIWWKPMSSQNEEGLFEDRYGKKTEYSQSIYGWLSILTKDNQGHKCYHNISITAYNEIAEHIQRNYPFNFINKQWDTDRSIAYQVVVSCDLAPATWYDKRAKRVSIKEQWIIRSIYPTGITKENIQELTGYVKEEKMSDLDLSRIEDIESDNDFGVENDV